MKREALAATVPKGKWSCPDTSFAKAYPTLAQALCDPWWDDGKPRVPFTMTIRFDGNTVNICLNDKEGSRGAYTTAEGLPEAYALVNAALETATLSWRRWKK